MKILKKYHKILKYFIFSCISTVFDILLVWLLYNCCKINLIVSNSAGIILGFCVSYVLSSKSVFDTKLGTYGFLIYFSTFVIGLIFADVLIYISNKMLIIFFSEFISFFVSKAISIILPFFLLYFLRKELFSQYRRRKKFNE